MKPTKQFLQFGQWAAFSVAVMGSANILFATPQLEPSGDDEIAAFIQMDIRADEHMKGAKVDVKIDDGIAILTGRANSLAQTERATARAIASNSVQAVVNQMEIKEAPSKEIAAGAKLSLETQKLIRASDISVITNGSRLILKGEVGTWDESDLAREIVSEIPGVAAIENHLTVNFEGERTDAQIAAQLKFIINDDPLYEGLHLVANVKSGTVKLGGEVGSRGEFDRLVRRSYVTGVVDVQLSGLSINSDLAMEAVGDKDYTPEQSIAALGAALAHDSRIKAEAIQLGMADGVMALKGTVPTLAQSDAVQSTARGIPGVLRVDNQLRIGNEPELVTRASEVKSASAPLMKPPTR